jgi:type IV pilus assembly protein PilA
MRRLYHSGMKKLLQAGFTWVELMFVIAVIAILAMMAIPGLQENALKRQVKEGIGLADLAKSGVQSAYRIKGEMPADNAAAGIPAKEKIVSAMVKEVIVESGAITLTFGNNASKVLDGKHLTIRPAVVTGETAVPISWICHDVAVPTGMELKGTNRTDIEMKYLPIECRGIKK